MNSGKQKCACIQTEQSGGNAKRSMTFRGERTVTDLSGLEGDNHVGGRSKHSQVTGNRRRERHLEPIVGACIREGGSEHLANGHVGGNIRQDCNDNHEPVDARNASHLISTATHGNVEERLRDASVIEGSDKSKLSNEKHEKTIIDLGKSSLGLGDKFFLLGLNLVSIHVISLFGWKRVASVIKGEK